MASIRSRRQLLVIVAPLCAALLFGVALTTAHAGNGPPRLGVGNVISDIDFTTESFSVHRFLRSQGVTIAGARPEVVLVDHPGEADFAVTGEVEGKIEKPEEEWVYQHEFRLRLVFWRNGKKVGSHSTNCSGTVPLTGETSSRKPIVGPPDYRYEALVPCLRGQLGPMAQAMEAAR